MHKGNTQNLPSLIGEQLGNKHILLDEKEDLTGEEINWVCQVHHEVHCNKNTASAFQHASEQPVKTWSYMYILICVWFPACTPA